MMYIIALVVVPIVVLYSGVCCSVFYTLNTRYVNGISPRCYQPT